MFTLTSSHTYLLTFTAIKLMPLCTTSLYLQSPLEFQVNNNSNPRVSVNSKFDRTDLNYAQLGRWTGLGNIFSEHIMQDCSVNTAE